MTRGRRSESTQRTNRILIAQRGEFRLPTPVPPEFGGFAGSLKMNVLILADRRVWVINETFHTVYVFSKDGKQLLKTLGEKNVPGSDATHFAKPQDVAFLPDGRILIADGLDNHRVMIMDKDVNYLGEFGGKGAGPGQFNGVHAVAVGPGGRIFALDRSGGRINVFRTTPDPKKVEFVAAFPGFSLPLDLIVDDDSLWVTDLKPLRFVKLDFSGNHLYTWLVPSTRPDGYLEVHTFSVDAAGNLYGGDNQYGRTQKFVPKAGSDKRAERYFSGSISPGSAGVCTGRRRAFVACSNE